MFRKDFTHMVRNKNNLSFFIFQFVMVYFLPILDSIQTSPDFGIGSDRCYVMLKKIYENKRKYENKANLQKQKHKDEDVFWSPIECKNCRLILFYHFFYSLIFSKLTHVSLTLLTCDKRINRNDKIKINDKRQY